MILTISNPFSASKKKIRQKKKARKLTESAEKKPRAKTAGPPDSSRRPMNLEGFGMMQPTGIIDGKFVQSQINQSTLSVQSGASSARTQTSQMVLDLIAKDEKKKEHVPYEYEADWQANVDKWNRCEIQGCAYPAGYRCDRKLEFTTKWEPCGRKLCQQHADVDNVQGNVTGQGHCCSYPRTQCEQNYDIANKSNLKEMSYFIGMMVLIFFILLYMFLFKFTVKSVQSKYWDILINNSVDYNYAQREMTPLSGNYSNTIIWLHDFDSSDKLAQSYFENDETLAKETRIVIPQAPYRDMNYEILGQDDLSLAAWFNMQQTYGNLYKNGTTSDFSHNGKFYSQEDIEDQVDRMKDIIQTELKKYPDENPARIFIGGLSMGASMALATYLSYEGLEPLGGVISLYGINPLDWSEKKQTSLQQFISSRTPVLLMNNVWLLNAWDIGYAAKQIEELHPKDAAKYTNLYEYIITTKMGTAPSNIVNSQLIERQDTDFLEQSRDLSFGTEQHAKILSFFNEHRVNDGVYNIPDKVGY